MDQRRYGIQESERPHEDGDVYRVVIFESVMPGEEGYGMPVWSKNNDLDPKEIATFPFDITEAEPDRSFWIYDANDCNCLLYEELAWIRYDADVGRFVPIGSQGLTRKAIATVDSKPQTTKEFELAKGNETLRVPDPDNRDDEVEILIDVFSEENDTPEGNEVWVQYCIGEESIGDVYRKGKWKIVSSEPGGAAVLIRASATIAARNGSSPGSGTCTILTANSSDEIITTADTITVYNYLTVPIMSSGERMGQAIKIGDLYWAISDDCHDVTED